MFSTRNGQAVPGIKNFGMQGPPKGVSGVRVFKGPTISSFNPNPFSVMSAHFDSFDVGYRPSQAELSQRLNGPSGSQPQNWRTPTNIYPPSHPPQLSSYSYQQNPQFGRRNSNTAPSAASRSQETTRQSQPYPKNPSNYSIYPGISTDMYIYEASDVHSEYSPSPSPSTFSPALSSTDSTVTLEPSNSFPERRSDSRERDGRATPSMRANTPAPASNQTATQPQSYMSTHPSSSGTDGVPFPSGISGIRQAQTALRGFFESNGQADRHRADPNGQHQNSNNSIRSRARTSSSAAENVMTDSDAEFDHLARMNTALNAGYSHYYPESRNPSLNPPRTSTASSASANRRSPRDSLMFLQHIQHSPDLDFDFQNLGVSGQTSQNPLGTEVSAGQVPEGSGSGNELNILYPPLAPETTSAPALQSAISNSSQSSEFSILEAPPSRSSRPYSQLYPDGQHDPNEQVATAAATVHPTYTTILSASPEPQLSSSPTTLAQEQAPSLLPDRSHSQSSPPSSASSTTLNGTENGSFPLTTSRDRPSLVPGGIYSSTSLFGTAPALDSQGYPMPHGTETEARSPRGYGEQRGGSATSGDSDETRLARRSPLAAHAPSSSPPRTYGQDSQRVDTSPLPTTVPAPPTMSDPSQPPQTRARKDSMNLGMTTSSSSRGTSRSYPHTPSYSNTSTGGHNGERHASSFSAVQSKAAISFAATPTTAPAQNPSSFPGPRRSNSDGDNPSLTDATRRSSVPFQSEFVPALSTSASAQVSSNSNRDISQGRAETSTRDSFNQFPPSQQRAEPQRARSSDISRPPGNIQIKPEALHLRSVRWNEDLICPSPIFPSQRRKGWFNRRGDQLWTNGGAFRSPPQGGEYPLDLEDYPEYGQGWMNEEGVRIDMAHRLIPKPPLRSALKGKRANGSHTGC